MATIRFKAKVTDAITMRAGEVLYQIIQVPVFTRAHCDMPAFRAHAKYGSIVNSELFLNALARIRRDITKTGGWIRLDQLPDNVKVESAGFLSIVTIEV